MRYYPINEDTARTAWSMNHMGTFNSDEKEYMQEVDQAYEIAEEAAQRSPDQRNAALEMADKFAKRLANWYNRKYRIDSMCPSMLIAGPANFPVRKKEKQNRATDRLWEDYRNIIGVKERIRKLGEPSKVIKAGVDDAPEKLREKIAELTEKQESMKAANAQARKEGKQAPYAPYKPSDEIRGTLKKNGFRWSPKQGAWQRQLTANARFALRLMLKTAAEQPTSEQHQSN